MIKTKISYTESVKNKQLLSFFNFKTDLYFKIDLNYDPVTYKALIELGKPYYNKEKKIYEWFFPIKHLKKVREIVGIPILINEDNFESIPLSLWKGKDKVEIIELPEYFKIIEHRKQEDGSVKEQVSKVSKELVISIWENVIKKMPLNKPIKTRTVIENIFKSLNLKVYTNKPRALRDTKNYLRFFYYPIKVLQHYKVVIHHKKGLVERISDDFEIQSKLLINNQNF